MAILERELKKLSSRDNGGSQRHLFTLEEYRALAGLELFADLRFELIEGEIIDMAPIGDAHASVNDPVASALRAAFGSGFAVRTQAPILIGSDVKPSMPQPDVAVVVGSWRDYVARTPTAADVKLIVEVADSTVIADRKVKAALYAAAEVPEFWIVNLIDRCVEVHRDPSPAGYGSRKTYRSGESINPLLASGNGVHVADFMP